MPVSSSSGVRFGTDGWRGIIARDFTFQNVRLVAHAVAKTFENKEISSPLVPIGFDHRFLADHFAEETAKVLSQHHFKPQLLTAAVTSPLLSFITWKQKSPFGVMITASHNPAEYCGFKVKGSFGGSISQATALRIEKNLNIKLSGLNIRNSARPDKHQTPLKKFLGSYLKYLKRHIDFTLFRKASASVTFDALYGPGGKVVQTLFNSVKSRLEVDVIHNRRDTLFGGLHPEPIEMYLEDLKQAVRKSRSWGGFALDGDGDRLGLVDEKGRYLTPQQTFSLLLYYLAAEKKLYGKVVQAVSLGYLSERIAEDFNLPFKEVPVGFKHVAEEILKGGVLLGGEESGGYGFSKTHPGTPSGSILPERDGLFCSLLILEMLGSQRRKMSEILDALQKRYGTSVYLRKDIPLSRPIGDKSAFIANVQNRFPSKWYGMKIKEMRTLDGLKIILQDGSWILVRPSGTEPLLRTYVEFPSASLSKKSLLKLPSLIKNSIIKS